MVLALAGDSTMTSDWAVMWAARIKAGGGACQAAPINKVGRPAALVQAKRPESDGLRH